MPQGVETVKERITEELLSGEIVGFVREDSGNMLELDHLPIYNAPLVGFVSGTDPLFDRLKTVIGSFHRTPVEMMHDYAALKGCQPSNEDTVGVIAIILPMHAAMVRENASMADGPSRRLIHGKYYGGAFRQKLTRHIIAFLTQRGYLAASPEDEPGLHQVTIDPSVGLTSNWSLRHVAYAAGLGTFGLSDGLITNAGIAQEIGSILVDSPFASPERPDDIHAACLYYQQNKCMACMKRCPAGAITEQGHDKERCRQFAFAQTTLNEERYGIKTYGCGLCFWGVPCASKNPAISPARRNRLGMTLTKNA